MPENGRDVETYAADTEVLDEDIDRAGEGKRRKALLYIVVVASALAVGALLWLYVFPWVMMFLPENF